MHKAATAFARGVANVPSAFVGGYFLSTTGAAIGLLGLTFAILQNPALTTSLGAVLATRAIASFTALASGGWLVARFNPKATLMVIEATYALMTTVLGCYLLSGGQALSIVFALSAGLGLLDGFFIPTNSAFIRSLAEDEELTRINALVATSASLSKVAGAAAAGALVAFLAPAVLLFVTATTYIAHFIAVVMTRVQCIDSIKIETGTGKPKAIHGALMELRNKPWIVAIALQATLINVVAWSPYTVIGPQLSSALYGGPPAWAGLSMAYGTGAVLTGIALTWKQPRSLVRVIVASFTLWLMPLFCLAMQVPLGLSLAGAVLAGTGTSLFNVAWASVLQQQVARRNLSQVVSWVSVGPQIVAPLGLLAAGTFHSLPEQSYALGIGGVIALLGALALWALPMVRRFVSHEMGRG